MTTPVVIFDFPPFVRTTQERLRFATFVQPSVDPKTGVTSKDVVLQKDTGLSARLYLPKIPLGSTKKLPLVIYFHGGGFIIESAFCATYHDYLNLLVSEANVVAISVDYRMAPDHPVPIAYDDCWTALEWVRSHSKEEEWFKKYVDFDRVFTAGDSAGGNISQNIGMMEVGKPDGLKIRGMILIHPYFLRSSDQEEYPLNANLWRAVCPLTNGLDDPTINPLKHPDFSKLGCERVLVCVAELDWLRDMGVIYYAELLKIKSEWVGKAEFLESPGKGHVFFLTEPTSKEAKELMKKIVSFINPPLTEDAK